jgi:hypothetical protein
MCTDGERFLQINGFRLHISEVPVFAGNYKSESSLNFRNQRIHMVAPPDEVDAEAFCAAFGLPRNTGILNVFTVPSEITLLGVNWLPAAGC